MITPRTDPVQIVLLPGLDGTGVLFSPLLNALPPEIQPVVVTYPPDQALGYDELLPIVLKALPQATPFVLLGESFGGPLALRVAATHPAGLLALILCASFVSCPHRFVPRWVAPLVMAFPFRAIPRLAQIKSLLGGYATRELLSLSKEALSSVQPEVLARRTQEIIKIDVTLELVSCNVPILYIQGKHDMLVPRGNLERILRIKPTVKSVQLSAPHMVLQTQPTQAADAIVNFIANHTR